MISVLHTESSMNLGGQELRILAEMEGLAGLGYRSALAARPGSRILREALGMGLAAYPVTMRGSIDPAAVYGFMRIMRAEGAQILNAHGSKDGWGAGIAARMLGLRVVRSRHIANPIRSHMMGRLVYGALCDRVVTTSDSIRQGMVDRGVEPGKIISVPTGVDTERFNPDVAKGTFRTGLGIGADRPLVGMVSVMRGDKGPDVFVRAAELVIAKVPDAVFVLVGDGWMREELAEMVSASPCKASIIVAGYRRDIPSVLADLDIMALPARIPEGVPQAVLQAHAMKVPVVASEVGGINEVAISGKTALTVPSGDHAALAEAIRDMLSDKARAASLAEAGYRLVMERYTFTGMLERMDGIYKDVLGIR
ncbi:MAG: glycosyltransferase family 4 protein [Nitrospirae bacterium]|nr:glycosyltransferase family 4 protein [Nitrospirota bacterium]